MNKKFDSIEYKNSLKNISLKDLQPNIDNWLFFTIIIIFFFGLFSLYSASNQNPIVIQQQSFRFILSFIAFFIASKINSFHLKKNAKILYVFFIFLLLLVFFLGHTSMGATRWLDLYFIKFQPSEFLKLVMPIFMAWIVTKYGEPNNIRKNLFYISFLIIPFTLILLQPDLGTAIIILMSGLIVIFLAGIPKKYILSLLILGFVSIPLIWNFMLHNYQKERILTLFNPENDPLGTGYHIIQSKIAIGNGGFNGLGWLQGTQSHLSFIPEQTTDFIYAVIAEEFGFLGLLCLLFLYFILIIRCLYMSYNVKDIFSKLLITSYITIFSFYVFINIGMVSGILPVVGVPLPLISFGGTSMFTIMISFGFISGLYKENKIKK